MFHSKQAAQIVLANFWRKIESQLREYYGNFHVQIFTADFFQNVLIVRRDLFRFLFVKLPCVNSTVESSCGERVCRISGLREGGPTSAQSAMSRG